MIKWLARYARSIFSIPRTTVAAGGDRARRTEYIVVFNNKLCHSFTTK